MYLSNLKAPSNLSTYEANLKFVIFETQKYEGTPSIIFHFILEMFNLFHLMY